MSLSRSSTTRPLLLAKKIPHQQQQKQPTMRRVPLLSSLHRDCRDVLARSSSSAAARALRLDCGRRERWRSPLIVPASASSSHFFEAATTVGTSTRHFGSSSKGSNRGGDDDDVRSRLVRCALDPKYINEHGWTRKAIAAAAASSDVAQGSSIAIAGLVDPEDLIRERMSRWNGQLELELQREARRRRDSEEEPRSTLTDRLEFALRRRLELNTYSKEAWKQAMALGARPDNVVSTRQLLEEMIDVIAKETATATASQGESSPAGTPLTDAEKFALGGVYVATELHWLASNDHQETWHFLRERLREWDRCRSVLQKASPGFDFGSSASDAAFVASAVTSAFLSGVASLIVPSSFVTGSSTATAATNNMVSSATSVATAASSAVDGVLKQVGSSGFPVPTQPPPLPPPVEHIWNSIFGDDDDIANGVPAVKGTHQSDYDAPSRKIEDVDLAK